TQTGVLPLRLRSKNRNAAMADASTSSGITLHGPAVAGVEHVLTPAALHLLAELHRRFEPTRQALLTAREVRQASFDAGTLPDFRPDTRNIRDADWRVAPIPAALQDRRVEITGPVD